MNLLIFTANIPYKLLWIVSVLTINSECPIPTSSVVLRNISKISENLKYL